MSEKIINILNAAVFSLIIAIIGFTFLFAPRSEFSETEKRELAKFPEFSWEAFLSGEFTKKINLCFSDTIPFREEVTEASARLKNIMGKPLDGVSLHKTSGVDVGVPAVTEKPDRNKKTEITEKKEQITKSENTENIKNGEQLIPSDEEFKIGSGEANIGNNGILVYQNRGLMLYGGSRPQRERYAAALNSYRSELDKTDINIYAMLIPTSTEFFCPDNYRDLSGNQRDDINHTVSLLNEKIIPVNAYSALAAHLNEDIYLRTDHHWAPLGAYYAAAEFCKTAGVDFPALTEYEKVTVNGYVGTLYGYSGDMNLKNNPEDFIYFKPKNKYSTVYYNYNNPTEAINSSLFVGQSVGMSYCIFMGGDSKITHIETDVENGRKLAVFKDSYGNALVPFLVNSFEEIFIIDIRYFPYKAVEYLKENNITDVLFCNNIFAANTGSLIACIEDIMK